MMLRRLFLTLALIAASLTGAQPVLAQSGPPPVTAADRILGRADAPVTVIEYASLVCSHCGEWHEQEFADFKTRFIDTGKVRMVFRDLPTAPVQVGARAAGIARCAVPARYYDVIHAFYSGQDALFATNNAQAWYALGIAASGRTQAQIETCLADPATLAGIRASIAGASAAGVEGTPTFFVNGRRNNDNTADGLAAAITPLLPARSR